VICGATDSGSEFVRRGIVSPGFVNCSARL